MQELAAGASLALVSDAGNFPAVHSSACIMPMQRRLLPNIQLAACFAAIIYLPSSMMRLSNATAVSDVMGFLASRHAQYQRPWQSSGCCRGGGGSPSHSFAGSICRRVSCCGVRFASGRLQICGVPASEEWRA